MCLTVTNIVNPESARVASDLKIGTWFRDNEKQVYVVANDDKSDQPVIICVGSYFKPFVVHMAASEIPVSDILSVGTGLHVTKDHEGGF